MMNLQFNGGPEQARQAGAQGGPRPLSQHIGDCEGAREPVLRRVSSRGGDGVEVPLGEGAN